VDTSLEMLRLHSSMPYQQQYALQQTRPQSDAASVVLSNVSRTYSNWSFPPLVLDSFVSLLTSEDLKLIQTSSKYDPLCIFLRLAQSDAYGCYGINLSWYPVLSKFSIYRCKHLKIFVDSPHQKVLILSNICGSYVKI